MAKHLDADKPLTKAQKAAAAGNPRKPRKPAKERIPTLPSTVHDVAELPKPSQRSVAVVNMRLAGTPWQKIADELGYASVKDVEQAYIAALAGMYPVESWETLRQTEALRAELLINIALPMATADFLVDANDPRVKIPNTEKRLWHEQALKAVALHSTITGAKAPTKVEVSADTQELNAMVQVLLQQRAGSGEEIVIEEASIWDVDELEQSVENPVEE
jgi:hypothetical protein